MRIVMTALFERRAKKLLDRQARLDLERELAANPLLGDVVPGLRGLRKMRFARPGRGKRGGIRIVYLYVGQHETVFLLTVYAKNRQDDLTGDDRRTLLAMMQALEDEL